MRPAPSRCRPCDPECRLRAEGPKTIVIIAQGLGTTRMTQVAQLVTCIAILVTLVVVFLHVLTGGGLQGLLLWLDGKLMWIIVGAIGLIVLVRS